LNTKAYADQIEHDHAIFKKEVLSGRVKTVME